MKKPRDPMIATALEYESATLDTLRALDGTDGRRRSACLHFDAMAAMEAMPDRDRGLTYLMQRGRILDFAWKTDYTPRWKSLPRTSARRFTEPPARICRVYDRARDQPGLRGGSVAELHRRAGLNGPNQC